MTPTISYETLPDLAPEGNNIVTEPIANKSFSYNTLDDRRFEELLFSIFRQRTQTDNFLEYDTVSLMNGVRDKGRDCAFFFNAKSTGVIQCKKYASPFNKQQFGEEITKYVLYSLIDGRLLPDPENFCYIIAASSGLTMECSDFIDHFNNTAPQDENLSKWISKNTKNPTLSSLDSLDITTRVAEIFRKITVKKIIPQELDIMLHEPSRLFLIPLFFDVKVVTDNSEIQTIVNTLESMRPKEMNHESLHSELLRGSTGLRSENNIFDDIPDSHIKRNETGQLLDWIQSPVERDEKQKPLNICLLAANAGMGKTVILKDLYDLLAMENVAVLGLKADKLVVSNLEKLQHKVGLSQPIFQFIDNCKRKYEKVVILIDQIDALSQTMSADRSSMEVFKTLVDGYTHDENVRLIVSVRIFDLNYDPSLRVYRKIKAIKVELLQEEDVLNQIAKLGVGRHQVNAKLLTLLRTPNHLNIFSRIAKQVGNSLLDILTVQDLYDELWKAKVMSVAVHSPTSPKKLKKLLYRISKDMYRFHSITVSESRYASNLAELSYLESERLIKREDKQLQFFHQTFYDYIFAKRFVEKNLNLNSYIKEQEQSMRIRSAVKMILQYLRDYDPVLYKSTLEKLFEDTEILYHLKHMIYCWMCYQNTPTDREYAIVMQLAQKEMDYCLLFLDHVLAEIWFNGAIEYGILDKILAPGGIPLKMAFGEAAQLTDGFEYYKKRRCVQFLNKFLHLMRPQALEYIKTIQDEDTLGSILYHYNQWDDPILFNFLERCATFTNLEYPEYLRVVDTIAETDPSYSFEKIKTALQDKSFFLLEHHLQYERYSILKTLSKHAPKLLIPVLEQQIVSYLDGENLIGEGISRGSLLDYVDLGDKEPNNEQQTRYNLLAKCLKRAAGKNKSCFRDFITRHSTSRYEAVLRLVIYGCKNREEQYHSKILDMFRHFATNNHFPDDDFGIEFRDAFEIAFKYFSTEQQYEVIEIIKNIKLKSEAFISRYSNSPVLFVGRSQYLLLRRLPSGLLDTDEQLRLNFKALARKFKAFKEKKRFSNRMASLVMPPIPAHAFNYMTHDQWLDSFRKYNRERGRLIRDHAKGDMSDHAIAFQDFCKTEPLEAKVAIIHDALLDASIDFYYIAHGLTGIAKSDYPDTKLFELYNEVIPLAPKEDTYLYGMVLEVGKKLLIRECFDDKLLDLFVTTAVDYTSVRKYSHTEKRSSYTEGLTSTGRFSNSGTAISGLIQTKMPELQDKIFTVIEEVLSNGPRESRAFAYSKFAFLNTINKQRSFELFIKSLEKEPEDGVTAACLWSIQYMTGINFEALIPIFQRLIKMGDLSERDSQWLFSILYFSELYGRPAKILLHELLLANSQSRSWAFREIVKHFYFNESSKDISIELLLFIIDATPMNEENVIALEVAKLDSLKPRDVRIFLEHYIEKAFFTLPKMFISYLTFQCTSDPLLCVELFLKAMEKVQLPTNQHFRIETNETIIKFLAVANMAVKGRDGTSIQVRTNLLEVFNVTLKDYRFRNVSEKILEDME